MAALTAPDHPTVLWARDAALAAEITDAHTNERYLPGFSLPSQLRATNDLAKAGRHAEVVIVGVPTRGFRSVLEAAGPFLPAGIPVVSLAKGIEAGTLARMSEIIAEVLPGHPPAVLTGPNLAPEILSGQAAASVIASSDRRVAAQLQSLLQHELFRVYTNHDVIGCEVGGALQNVMAIAAGIAEGLGVGDNTRAAVITRGLAELTRLGVAMGAEAQTLAGLAGLGDLLVTCVSPLSRNRSVGERLGRGQSLDQILGGMHMVAEGVDTAELTMALAQRYGVELPICREVYNVITGRTTAVDAYRGLGGAGHEADPG